MKTRGQKLYLFGLSLMACATVLLGLSCGGGSGSGSSASNSSDPPVAVTPLSISDVTTVVQNFRSEQLLKEANGNFAFPSPIFSSEEHL